LGVDGEDLSRLRKPNMEKHRGKVCVILPLAIQDFER